MASYSGSPSSLTHTLERVADSLTPGLTYSIKFRARNAVGDSPFSGILRVGLGDEPNSITGLAANIGECGPTFVAMSWPRVAASVALPALGYLVEMIDPISDEWVVVLDARTNADADSFVYYGAVTG